MIRGREYAYRTTNAAARVQRGARSLPTLDALVDSVLAVPHSLIERRQRACRKKVDANLNRRGPERKVRSSASSGRAEDS